MSISKSDLRVLAIGFRYEKSFKLIDMIGETIERILRDSSSPFGTDFFPRYEDLGFEEKILIGKNGTFLKIGASEIVLRYVLNKDAAFETEYAWFRNDAIAFIIDQILKVNQISEAIRIGIVFTHIVESKSACSSIIDKLTDGTIRDADQFSLSFGKKDTALEGWLKRQVDDYCNKVTLIRQIDNAKYDVTLDYQYYFSPYLNKLADWPILDLLERAHSYLNASFYETINSLIPEGALTK